MIIEIIPVMVITVPFSEKYVCAFLYVIKSKFNLTFNCYTLRIPKIQIFGCKINCEILKLLNDEPQMIAGFAFTLQPAQFFVHRIYREGQLAVLRFCY